MSNLEYKLQPELQLEKKLDETNIQNRPTIDELIDKGYTLKLIGKAIGKTGAEVYGLLNKIGKHERWKERRIEAKKRPEADKLISEGYPLSSIAEKIGLSRQGTERYIHITGQYKLWTRKKKQIKETTRNEKYKLNEVRKTLLSQIEQRVTNLAEQSGWAYVKTIEFYRRSKFVKIPFERIFGVFEIYEQNQSEGKKIGLKGIAKELGLLESYAPEIGKILSKTGVKPFYGNRERKFVTADKKAAIERAFCSELSSSDVAYFLKVPVRVVQDHFKKLGDRKYTRYIKQFNLNPKDSLTYRLASEIYDGIDEEISIEDTIFILGKSKIVIEYALENRATIEPVIKNWKEIFKEFIS
ncbi:hypothetical protein J4437_06790 [Candidatus Woesearchaeota archaeon]|nr:hypothetical protein [Candidatus Woesearchaeota archaeon]